ncbi:hypothetical protein EBZ97_02380 [bacterium]|nr:hypothetical protein [bacterium]
MENFKKNKGFYTLIAILLAGFIAGVVFCFLSNSSRAEEEKKLTVQLGKYRALLKGQEIISGVPPVSLTSNNVNISKADHDALVKQRDDLRLAISAVSTNRFVGKENLASSDLASSIKQNVDEWTKLAADKDIRMLPNEKCDFGFRRYIRNPGTSPKGATLSKVDQQLQIIDFIYRTLVDSRPNTPNRSTILLQSIDRAATPVLGSTANPTAPAKEERKVVVHQNFSEIALQIDYLSAPEDKPVADAEPKK